MQYDIPILFVIFRRKDVTMRTFAAIKAAQPAKLYIACDGAREAVSGEQELVEATRQAVENAIDWPCEVHRRYQDHNQGCAKAVSSAISWMFETEEMGIILEDDCVAKPSFFKFVREMLHRYKDDQRIGMVAGTNLVSSKVTMPDSYCFSKYKACWGWATWKRAWSNLQLDMPWRDSDYYQSVIANNGFRAKDKNYWKYRLNLIDANYVSSWDWPWYFCLAAQNQLCIFPSKDLIVNIGFDAEATHTSFFNLPKYKDEGELSFPLRHPRYIVPYEPFDKAFYKANNNLYMRLSSCIPLWLKRKLKKMLK
jgi:hypothetical protein